jgi:hypothetical protein
MCLNSLKVLADSLNVDRRKSVTFAVQNSCSLAQEFLSQTTLRVVAAEGCNLLMFFSKGKIKRSQSRFLSTAPTGLQDR